ncbi:LacI family DNA-binding transcriptional regulator [Arthrobacter sp. NPDC056691]|uniref:LacI family DNA-binding transcriptional regulator n=1 Tax=unclassified Arthrobacter TaxID=235627 RepID=UPI003672C14B
MAIHENAKRVGIIDVAREAGVSTATVSFVLAGKQPVADGTRERVLEVVRRLGYQRNRHARALRRGASRSLSAVVPDVTNPFYAELVAAIENAASSRGWMLSLMNCQLDRAREVSYLNTVFDEVPDGIIYVPMTSDAVLEVESRFDSGPPIVIVDEITSHAGLGAVSVDNDAGARMVARHFRSLGRRRALVTGPPQGLPTSQSRSAGFVDEAAKVGLEVAHAAFGEIRTSDAGAVAAELLLKDRTIDAYFAGNDFLAIQVLFELQRAGVRVPEDIAICGFDGIGWGQMITPRLTTVRQPLEQIANAVIDLISKPADEHREIVLPVEFVRGQTA